jgi:hypothetical protein
MIKRILTLADKYFIPDLTNIFKKYIHPKNLGLEHLADFEFIFKHLFPLNEIYN